MFAQRQYRASSLLRILGQQQPEGMAVQRAGKIPRRVAVGRLTGLCGNGGLDEITIVSDVLWPRAGTLALRLLAVLVPFPGFARPRCRIKKCCRVGDEIAVREEFAG